MAYVLSSTLKDYLGVEGVADDALLGDLIDRAKSVIDVYCNRTFEATADTTRYFDANRDVDRATLYLDEELAAITTVTNGDGAVLNGTAHYVTEPGNTAPYYALRLRLNSGTLWTYTTDPERAISITGKWAYSATAPPGIVQACVRLAGYLYRQKDNAAELDRPILAGNATILPASLPSDIYAILAPYRKVTK